MNGNKFNEDTLSEKPAIEQLKGMGYKYISGDKFDPQETEDSERTSRREVVLIARLRKKLTELNPEATEETIEKAVRQVTSIQGTGLLDENRGFYKDLASNISIEQDYEGRRRNVTIKFIEFDEKKIEKNEFLVVNQFWVKGPKELARPDIVIFINGIPLAVIECKSPVARETGVGDAIGQLIRYQNEIPSLFRTNQILIGCNLFGAKYGVVGVKPEDFHEWKAKNGDKLPILSEHPSVKEMLDLKLISKKDLTSVPAAQDVLIAALFNKRNLLDIVCNFIVFDTEQGKLKKKICRYQQFTTVHKMVKRVLDEHEKKGIIWHWQGSGKSLTMLFAALKLKRAEDRLKNPFIVIVTDRKDLDGQIEGTFRRCGFPNPERAKDARSLYAMLSGGVGQTIMTTVQKFRNPLERPLSTSSNIIVLTDEAHRTQYGNYAFNLRKALPNAAFFAFTGTPLNKRDRNTYRLFSPEGENYLDRYSIKQSEEDKATVPIKYMSRMASLRIVGNTLDSMLKTLFPGKNKDELAELKKKYVTVDVLASSSERIERIVLDILEHYNSYVRPNGLKVMIVAADRAAVVKYKNILDRFIDPDFSKVVMTLDENKDPDEWKEKFRLSDKEEQVIKSRFNNPEDSLSFLIVCDKLLTGFDAPILQVVYLDQRLKEHTLLQAVARTNRNYPKKGYGIIVDYAGVGRELAQAVSMFGREDLAGLFRIDDVEKEFEKLREVHKAAMEFFKDLPKGKEVPKVVLQQCLSVLKDETVRREFDKTFRTFAKSMDFLMPDVRFEPYMKDFKFLGVVREGAKNLFRDDCLQLEILTPKIEALIHAHIAAEGIEELLAPLTISAPDFQEKLDAKTGEKAKAAHLEYAIRDTIHNRISEDPAFYGSLQDQLEKLIKNQKKERADDAQLLLSLMQLREKDIKKDVDAKELGLDGNREFAFFNLLNRNKSKIVIEGQDKQVSLTKDIVKIIETRVVTEWTERDDVQKEMRREIKRLLRKNGCKEGDLPGITREIMELAQHWMKR